MVLTAAARRAEAKRQRASDLRLMMFTTFGVLFFMVFMLVYMHMTQDLHSELEAATGAGDAVAARKKLLKRKVAATRQSSEAAYEEVLRTQRQSDDDDARSASRCGFFAEWQGALIPCGDAYVKKMKEPPLIVTDHFSTDPQYLLPHYDELGPWDLSIEEPQLWNVHVAAPDMQRRLYCAEPWLSISHHFDPLGSMPTAALHAIDAAKQRIALPDLLKDATAREGLLISVTHNVEALGQDDQQPDARLIEVVRNGMEFAIEKLLPKPLKEWTVRDIEAIHGQVCAGEPLVEEIGGKIGQIRAPQLHVGYGFSIPPPLGYELPYLMDVFVAWLGMVAEKQCLHPVHAAATAFALVQRMQPFVDCNTRVSKVLLNALLMKHGYPPVHMFLGASRATLRKLEGAYYEGKPDAFLTHVAEQVEAAARLAATGALLHYPRLLRKGASHHAG
eukprot:TRINITY_DN7983_c0_g1_i3.p1 TRINITY_DN7983_c0_g1~~TRINITY_DN7983_c0_g1_i3.p1  ORF type:complete len:446 (+),score=120.83 TRINITY_DN7983_c0_g1_i3:119-1456(+)